MEEMRFRNKITCFSFAFSLLVVWIHAYNVELFLGPSSDVCLTDVLEHILGERIGQIAVPGFFMISGCLFFRNLTWECLPGKMERRIHSVLVPYIIWNFLYYLGYVAGSRMPGLTDIIGRGVIPFNLTELTAAVVQYKYNPVFWFLFQLLLLIAAAPVLYPVLRCRVTRVIFFAVLTAVLVLDLRLPLLNADALLYYSAAGTVSLTGQDWLLEADGEKNAVGYRGAGLLLLFSAVILDAVGRRLGFPAALVFGRLFAVAGFWLLIPAALLPQAGRFAGQSFFLYATHFAFVRLINKTAARLFPYPAPPAVPFLLYLLMPAAALGAAALSSRFVGRFFPGLCRILNGGRR